MKLFCAPGSSSLLPHIVLLEAGLPFTAILIDEHTKAIEGGGDYRTVNPLGYVPALVLDDGTLLTEGPAIVQYIAGLVPSRQLAPANGTVARTKLQAWLNFFSSEMHKGAFGPLFYEGISEESKHVFRRRLWRALRTWIAILRVATTLWETVSRSPTPTLSRSRTGHRGSTSICRLTPMLRRR